ncbi:LysR family transcriptional regulator [Sneathiella aquimaris]|uniref:LysR family transcriptional regulator n=1 Tax=Sneathiella aquimaris TaxID=2599305 RepID=UPI00146BBAB6|nr:LysR family transcriptional regulator [Sneathiella aquimaris]
MGQFEDMSLFIRIADTGSITETAYQLNIAKSAVSRRLMNLEDRLGVQLLNRTTRKSSLTEAGRRFYRQSQVILSDMDELSNSMQQRTTELSGTLKVAVPLSFGLMHLSKAVIKFSELHPELDIDLNFADRQVDLVEEGFDLALRIADLADSSLVARKLTTIRHTLSASPSYLEKHGVPESFHDLKNHSLLKYSSPTGLTHFLMDGDGNRHEIKGKTIMTANNGDFLRQAAVEGCGLVFGPTFIVWKDIQAGSLIPVLQEYEYLELGAFAVYPQTRFLSARVRQFIDFLVDYFGPEPYWDAAIP